MRLDFITFRHALRHAGAPRPPISTPYAGGTMAVHPTPDCHSAGLVVHSLDSCLGRLRRP
jgi:hypothetical protein